MLPCRGYGLSVCTSADREIVRNIKETLCYVAADYEAEMKKYLNSPEAIDKTYELPDGTEITVAEGRFTSTECLFTEQNGLRSKLVDSVPNLRSQLYANIVLAGGTTMLEGFEERLAKELSKLVAPAEQVKLVAPPGRKHSA